MFLNEIHKSLIGTTEENTVATAWAVHLGIFNFNMVLYKIPYTIQMINTNAISEVLIEIVAVLKH